MRHSWKGGDLKYCIFLTAPDKYPDNFRGNPKGAETLDIVWTVSTLVNLVKSLLDLHDSSY